MIMNRAIGFSFIFLLGVPYCVPAEGDPPALSTRTQFVDEKGEEFHLSSLENKAVLLSFFYSECPNPNKCDRTLAVFFSLQTVLKKKQLTDRVALVLITLEPARDRPARLSELKSQTGLNEANVYFVCSKQKQDQRFIEDFALHAGHKNGIASSHRLRSYLMAPGGKLRKQYETVLWTPDEVLRELSEMTQP